MLSVGILIHELTIDAANRFVELLDATGRVLEVAMH